jgi:hypothetical protein
MRNLKLSLLGLILTCAVLPMQAELLKFDLPHRTASVDVRGWSLAQLLSRLSAETRWNILVEPGAVLPNAVSVRFNRIKTGDALRRLLRGMNFSLIPEGNTSRLLVYSSIASRATQAVKAKKSSRIENELVVVLKNGTEADAKKLAASLGAEIVGKIPGQNAYLFRFENDNASLLAREELNRRDDAEVDFNYRATQPNQALGQDAAVSAAKLKLRPGAVPDQNQMIVALIDTMVQANAVNSGFLLDAIAIGKGTPPETSLPTHGTSMFETLMKGIEQGLTDQTETGIRVLPIDVYGANATTTTYDVAAGIVSAMENGASILNLSLGTDSNSEFLHGIIQESVRRGAVVLAAAGNEPTGANTYPAAYPEVVAVTAKNQDGSLASYANFGDFVDVTAPGTTLVEYNGGIFQINGTSAATAFITGFATGTSASTRTDPRIVETALRNAFPYVPNKK